MVHHDLKALVSEVERVARGHNTKFEPEFQLQGRAGIGVAVPDAVLVEPGDGDTSVVVDGRGAEKDVANGSTLKRCEGGTRGLTRIWREAGWEKLVVPVAAPPPLLGLTPPF